MKPLGMALSGLALITLAACDTSSSGGGIDPGIIETPIAFIKRPIPRDDMGNTVQTDLREPLLFSGGGDVYLRTSTTVGADVFNLTASVTGGTGDVKGLNASYDGTKLIFSLRLEDPNPNDNVVPTWNVYEYDLENSQIRRVIPIDSTAEEGDDLYPAYLPDGRIVFTSSRQRQSREMLTNEGKDRFSALDEDEDTVALVLHVMDADGDNIHQISFNQSHDLYPQVLRNSFNGQIVFTRWDNAVGNNEMNLYKMNPDGSELEILYGARSHATGTNGANIQFTGIREMQNGDLMVMAKPYTGTFDGGDILIIDINRFVDINKPIWSLNGLGGPAQVAATINNVTTDGSISSDGRYSSAFPLRDGTNRMLVSKSVCQLSIGGEIRACAGNENEPGAQEVSPAYAIWLYDRTENTEKPIVLAEADTVITEVITIQAEPLPAIIFDKGAGELDSGWQTATVGAINIRSVYDVADPTFNGCYFNQCTPLGGITSVSDFADPLAVTADQRPARFVRFTRAVGIPDPDDQTLLNPPDLDNDAFGPQRIRGMREILGYAPVEPDGSVKVKVPANVPLALEILDAEGRRIGPRHLNWLQVQPGDTLNCTGCHDLGNGGAPPEVHGRSDAQAPSINAGLQDTGFGLVFQNTLIEGSMSPDPYWGEMGQTMAEVRFLRVPPLLEPQLSPDLVYVDYWTDPMLGPINPPYDYSYADLVPLGLTPPTNAFCSPWQFNCRITINYEEHIHPIWQVNRGAGVTCIECHTTTDAMGNDRVADAQLDLTDGTSDQNADHLKSYRELFFNDQGEELDGGGMLVNIQIQVPLLDGNGNPVLDGMGNPVFVFVDDPNAVVNPTMSVNGARASYFIEKLTETELDEGRALTLVTDPNYVDHSTMLSGVELKMISEWLDIGAQNFNNPFHIDAPQN